MLGDVQLRLYFFIAALIAQVTLDKLNHIQTSNKEIQPECTGSIIWEAGRSTGGIIWGVTGRSGEWY